MDAYNVYNACMSKEKPTTIRLSPERRTAIDSVRPATTSRQAWVDFVIDQALAERGKTNQAAARPRPSQDYVTLLADRQRHLEKARKR